MRSIVEGPLLSMKAGMVLPLQTTRSTGPRSLAKELTYFEKVKQRWAPFPAGTA